MQHKFLKHLYFKIKELKMPTLSNIKTVLQHDRVFGILNFAYFRSLRYALSYCVSLWSGIWLFYLNRSDHTVTHDLGAYYYSSRRRHRRRIGGERSGTAIGWRQ